MVITLSFDQTNLRSKILNWNFINLNLKYKNKKYFRFWYNNFTYYLLNPSVVSNFIIFFTMNNILSKYRIESSFLLRQSCKFEMNFCTCATAASYIILQVMSFPVIFP